MVKNLVQQLQRCLSLRRRNGASRVDIVPPGGGQKKVLQGHTGRHGEEEEEEEEEEEKDAEEEEQEDEDEHNSCNERPHGKRPRSIITPKPMLEAYWKGSWWDVELLFVGGENLFVQFLGYGEKNIEPRFVRLRSRRAYDSECKNFLKPNVNVSVYGLHPHASDAHASPAWYDAKIISVQKESHNPKCMCKFRVQFYSIDETDLAQRRLVHGAEMHVHISHLGILQKLSCKLDVKDVLTQMRSGKVISRCWSTDSISVPQPIFLYNFETHTLSKPTNKPNHVQQTIIDHAQKTSKKSFKFIEQGLKAQKKIMKSKTRSISLLELPKAQLLPEAALPMRPFKSECKSSRGLADKSNVLRNRGQNYAIIECGTKTSPFRDCSIRYKGGSGTPTSKEVCTATTTRREQHTADGRHTRENFDGGECDLINGPNTPENNSKKRSRAVTYPSLTWFKKYSRGFSEYSTLSKIKSVIQQKKRGWQRKLSILLSKKLYFAHHSGEIEAYKSLGQGTGKTRRSIRYPSLTWFKEDSRGYSDCLNLSKIKSVIHQKKRGWQRKLSILLSKKIYFTQHSGEFEAYKSLGQGTGKTPKKRGRPMLSNAESKAKKKLKFTEPYVPDLNEGPKKGISKSMRKVLEDARSSFNEVFRQAMEKNFETSTVDWSRLPPRKTCKSQLLEQVSGRTQSSGERKRKREQLQKKCHKPAFPKKPEVPDEFRFLENVKWSFSDFLKKAIETENEEPSIDWGKLPPSETAKKVIPWDPIVFHENLEDDEDDDLPIDRLQHLWDDMDLESSQMHLNQDIKEDDLHETSASDCQGAHHFVLDEEEGLICQLCGLIGCNIEAMLPPMEQKRSSKHQDRENGSDDEGILKDEECGLPNQEAHEDFPCTSPLMDDNTHETKASAWDLIPQLKEKMHAHQKDGFEFLWRNIAGAIRPSSAPRNEVGGCIISHAPGTGKSFLIISFLQSYMQMNPNCRPLLLAPTIMLRPWQREFTKWQVGIPVYILNTSEDSRRKRKFSSNRLDTEILTLASGSKISAKKYIGLHRMQIISEWHKNSSVLVISYGLFARLTDEENTHRTGISRNIGELLLQSPGLLILDEGHLARNHESKLRKSLIQVKTKLRILLSGTIFQNNCCELFNTFYLIRPTFMRDVIHTQEYHALGIYLQGMARGRKPKSRSQGPSFRSRKAKEIANLRMSKGEIAHDECEDTEEFNLAGKGSNEELEARTRRLFMEKIGKPLENGRKQRGKLLENAIRKLRSMTNSFVHYYAGEVLKSLPGLKDFTVMLKPSPLQEKILDEIAKTWDRRSSLELEYVVSCICIHPNLFQAMLNKQSCSQINLTGLDLSYKHPREGVKVRFILDLLRLCQVQNEKLLIFSQNIAPLDFLESVFSTEQVLKGEQVFKLQGNLALDDRQVVIDQFNKPKGKVRVLLASTRACGEGITLTGASRVVFLDMVWNPAVMKQAMSRAFRLGQSKEVFVYRLVASGTMEEEKYKRTKWKDWLSRSIFVSSINEDERKDDGRSMVKTGQNLDSKTEDPNQNFSLAFEEDAFLSSIIEQEKEDRKILKIFKHNCCLDQGDISSDDEEDVDS